MITVMGATGNTGLRITESLLAAGEKVRAIGRSADKLQPLVVKGAEACVGDAQDAAFLAKAFAGADAVYALIPPDIRSADYRAHQDLIGEAITEAVRESGVKHVVFLSSVGAELESGTGPIVGVGLQERRFAAVDGLNVLNLRPGSFFENFWGALGMIKAMGANGGHIKGDVPMAMIATRDIADIATEALRKRDFSGSVTRDLLGPRDLTMNEATAILGEKIGKPDLKYMELPAEAFKQGLMQAGFGESIAALYAEMAAAANEGKIRPQQRRDETPRTPTDFAEFADILAAAYNS